MSMDGTGGTGRTNSTDSTDSTDSTTGASGTDSTAGTDGARGASRPGGAGGPSSGKQAARGSKGASGTTAAQGARQVANGAKQAAGRAKQAAGSVKGVADEAKRAASDADATEPARKALEQVSERYAPDQDFPLGGYLGAMGVYGGVVGALGIAARLTHRRIDPPGPWDVVVGALATHRLSRLVARDPVTSPLRAPFTRLEGTQGPAELKEEVRGEGAQRTLGELLTCPFCTGMWVATGLSAGYVFAPRATRLAAAGLAALTGSDFLHFARAKLS